MVTHAAVGTSSNRSSQEAGRQAARAALDGLGGDRGVDLALVFATTGYAQQTLIDAVVEVLGDVPLAGCSSEGIIASDDTDESSHAVAVMVISAPAWSFATFLLRGMSERSSAIGEQLAAAVREHPMADKKALLLFPDGLTTNFTQLLSRLERGLPDDLVVAGGSAADMMRFEQTFQFGDGEVVSDGLAAVLIGGAVEVEQAVCHGCDAIGLERVVTEARGRRMIQIDGQPAWDVFREYLEGQPTSLRGSDISYLCIGEHVAGADAYGEYIVRVPVGHDRETGALIFGVEIPEGTHMTMTRRVPHRVMEKAVAAAEGIQRRHPEQKPALLLQMDCAGRGRDLFGARCTQMGLRPLQEVLGQDVPWLGCYTFGEIAALQKRLHFHNYTVVLCALYDVDPNATAEAPR